MAVGEVAGGVQPTGECGRIDGEHDGPDGCKAHRVGSPAKPPPLPRAPNPVADSSGRRGQWNRGPTASTKCAEEQERQRDQVHASNPVMPMALFAGQHVDLRVGAKPPECPAETRLKMPSDESLRRNGSANAQLLHPPHEDPVLGGAQVGKMPRPFPDLTLEEAGSNRTIAYWSASVARWGADVGEGGAGREPSVRRRVVVAPNQLHASVGDGHSDKSLQPVPVEFDTGVGERDPVGAGEPDPGIAGPPRCGRPDLLECPAGLGGTGLNHDRGRAVLRSGVHKDDGIRQPRLGRDGPEQRRDPELFVTKGDNQRDPDLRLTHFGSFGRRQEVAMRQCETSSQASAK